MGAPYPEHSPRLEKLWSFSIKRDAIEDFAKKIQKKGLDKQTRGIH